MNTKRKFSRQRRELTHYGTELIAKMRNTDYLSNSLSVGSKNRLSQYSNNLAVTRGANEPEFDSDLAIMLEKYVWNKINFSSQVAYLKRLRDKDGYLFSRNLKIYATTEDAMDRFSQPDHTSFRWNENYQQALKEVKLEFSKQRLHPLRYCDDDDISDALPKKDTHSGFEWIISGLKHKGDNLEDIYRRYKEQESAALESGSFEKPILIGFRTQASGEYEDTGPRTDTCKHKLRIVSMVDLFVILAELTFSKPIQEYMAKVPFYAGGKEPSTISGLIHGWQAYSKKFLSIDYTAFDQTISSWLIEDAFSIIKSAFIMTSEEEKRFDVIVHDFIHKDFILNEGVLHSDKGVPSGSMFTQIVDSIVNLVVVKTYFNSLNQSVEMMIMGDDNVIFTKGDADIEHLASYIIKNFGLIIKTDDKSNEGLCSRDNVKFLSRYWRQDGQWRHPNQLISRMLYPERHRDYSEEVGPQHVLFAFILTYEIGMYQLMDVSRFMHDFPISKSYVMKKVDSRYLPGALAYIREYT